MEKTESQGSSLTWNLFHMTQIEPETPIYLSETCYKLTQPRGWALSQQCRDSQKNLHRSQGMSSSSVTFISLVNPHQDEQGILKCLFFFFSHLEHVHLLELMHNSLRGLPSVPEYKLDFKKKSPLEHYVQGRSDKSLYCILENQILRSVLHSWTTARGHRPYKFWDQKDQCTPWRDRENSIKKERCCPHKNHTARKPSAFLMLFFKKKCKTATEIWEDLEQEIYKL